MLRRLGLEDWAEVDWPSRTKNTARPTERLRGILARGVASCFDSPKKRESGESVSSSRLRRRECFLVGKFAAEFPEIVEHNAATAITAARHSWSRSTKLDERLRASQGMTSTGEQDR
ncbi:hypothetical protein [Bradyrhizobium sp. 25ACV]